MQIIHCSKHKEDFEIPNTNDELSSGKYHDNLMRLQKHSKCKLVIVRSISDDVPLSLVKDKVKYRRKRVRDLCLKRYKQREIASKIGCSLSTIEKDFHILRGGKFLD